MSEMRLVRGGFGTVSSAHKLATEAALDLLLAGGSAIDAAICAQAMICVLMPQAAGLGGDMLMLVRAADSKVHAVNGTGRSASEWCAPDEGSGASVTVPGIVAGWSVAHENFGKLPLQRILAPAITLASEGFTADPSLIRARDLQRERLEANGAKDWSLLNLEVGDIWKQPELATLLRTLVALGPKTFYQSDIAGFISKAVRAFGGRLSIKDFASQKVSIEEAVSTAWGDSELFVQPPASQGVLLTMVAKWLNENSEIFGQGSVSSVERLDALLEHLEIEVTEAAFQYRNRVAADGAELLNAALEVNLAEPSHRGGPRSYLHTAGVAVTDASGQTVSSLVSVFDDFGSAIYVPELGLTLNNRADGFTSGANSYAPDSYPVHTLAPALLVGSEGDCLALATPGADGQVQTLVQILTAMRFRGKNLVDAIISPRWRSEDGRLLIEKTHPKFTELQAKGYRLEELELGSDIFGAIVATGIDADGPFASADFRRQVSAGAR